MTDLNNTPHVENTKRHMLNLMHHMLGNYISLFVVILSQQKNDSIFFLRNHSITRFALKKGKVLLTLFASPSNEPLDHFMISGCGT